MSAEVIWKFPLPLDEADDTGKHRVKMPMYSRNLTVQVQYGTPTLWAQVHPKSNTVTRIFEWVGTGGAAPTGGTYVGTIQDGDYVFHLYEVGASL